MMSRHWKKIFWVYLFTLGLICISIGGFATSIYGAGVGTDGALQISTADSLLRGEGLRDYNATLFVRWPPLYPVTIAALSWSTGIDTLTVGWYLNLFSFGLVVWLGGALLLECFRDKPVWPFLGSLVIATSTSLLSISVNIGTDILFTALVLAFLLAASRYLVSKSVWSIAAMGLLASLTALMRIPGVTLIGTGAILILYSNRSAIGRGFLKALLFSIITVIPVIAWAFSTNDFNDDTFFGVYLFASTWPLTNLQDGLFKILHWFIPYNMAANILTPLLIGLLLAVLLLVSRVQDRSRLGRRLSQPAALLSLLFGGVYFSFVVLTINSLDTRDTFFDRYYIVILVPVLILVFAILEELVINRLERYQNLARWMVVVLFAVWLIYPIYNLQKYARYSRSEGVLTYNRFNTRALRESEVVKLLQIIGEGDNQVIYTNYSAAAWYYTRKNVANSPRGSIMGDLDFDDLMQEYQGWPGDEPGYLVWFLPNFYDHVLEPEQLAELAELEAIYKGRDGEVYRVKARSP